MAVNRSKVLQKAEKLVVSGKLDAAVSQYQHLISDNPRDLGTLNKIGDLYVRLNKKPDAINTFTRIAEIYAEDGFFLKAIAIYKKITKIDPSSMDIMKRLAELYARQGLTTEARAQYLSVAQAFMKSGEPQSAIEAYEALATIEPDVVQHRLALAELKSKCGMNTEAAGTLLALGLELERKGNSKESARIYELAFKTSEGDPEVAERLASSLLSSGQAGKAREVAEKILGNHPDSIPMMEVRGLAMEAAGDTDEAEQALKSCLEGDPERAGSIIGLARILAGRGEQAQASETISGGMDAIVGADKGQEATEVLTGILEASPEFRPALEDLYRLQAMLGDSTATVATGRRLIEASVGEKHFAEALAVARRLTELEPGVPEHTQRLERIQDLADGKTIQEDMPGESVDLGTPGHDESLEASPVDEVATEEEPGATDEATEVSSGVEMDGGIEIEEEINIEDDEGAPMEVSAPEASPPVDRSLSSDDEEFISERMTEADVFVKYGLSDRAIEQLAAITEKFPWHTATRERLRDLYLEEGNRARAAIEAAELGKIRLQDQDNDGASAALDEARSIDPACPVIAELDALLRGEPVAAAQPLDPDELVEPGRADNVDEVLPGEVEPEMVPSEEEGGPTIAADGEDDSVPLAAAPVDQNAAALDDGFDLAAELDASLFGDSDGAEEGETVVSELEATPEAENLGDIVNAFKSEVDKHVDKDDFDTHYNLGIAYKEMGLLDEAIAEFQFASKSPALLASCCSMLGMCFREKGMQSIAVKWYRKGLDALAAMEQTEGHEEQVNGLRYDLAEVLEQMGEIQQARDLLTEVYGVNSRYRDVADRMKALEELIGG